MDTILIQRVTKSFMGHGKRLFNKIPQVILDLPLEQFKV